MLLTELPADILVLLPHYLHSIDDLYSVISTCRSLYTACNNPNVKLRPQLRRRDGQYLFQPHPHLLIAGCARQVGNWAVSSPDNRNAFHAAVCGGISSLLTLSTEVARISLKDMRELHEIKYSVLNPLATRLETENPKTSGRTVAETVSRYSITELEHADLCILHYWIYSDLFRHTIEASYRPVSVPTQLTDSIRLDYIKYCIPDENVGRVDLSSGAVVYNSLICDKWSELSFQQLDLYQLRNTSFCERIVATYLGFDGTTLEGRGSLPERMTQVLLHSGLATLRFILAISNARAQLGEYQLLKDAMISDMDLSTEDRAALRVAIAVKEEFLASRGDPWYIKKARKWTPDCGWRCMRRNIIDLYDASLD